MLLKHHLWIAAALLACAAQRLFAPVGYTLTVHVQGQGTVQLDPNGAVPPAESSVEGPPPPIVRIYGMGTLVILGAVPAPGWHLARWEGDASITTNDLTGIWGSGPNDVFAVGQAGTILHHASPWMPMQSNTTADLYGVWGSGPTNVFAVGGEPNDPNRAFWILHYAGSTWSPNYSGSWHFLNDVWGSGPNDIFAVGVGDSPRILHYNGINWSGGMTHPSGWLLGVWGSGPNDVYAVGQTGSILHYNGNGVTWAPRDSNSTADLHGVWGSGPNDVFVVGASGTILHSQDGFNWSPMPNGGVEATLYDVWGTGPNNVFTVGASGTILYYDGRIWSPMDSQTAADLYGVWGPGPNDVFAVGQAGTIREYHGVGGPALSDVFAVGQAAIIREYYGTPWTGTTIGAEPNVFVLMNGDKTVTAVFEPDGPNQYTLTVNNGTGSGIYDANAVVPIEATVPPGRQFDKWTGDTADVVDPNAASTAVRMTQDTVITATLLPQFTLTVNVEGQGSVQLQPEGGTYNAGTIVVLTAQPATGSTFVRWEGHASGANVSVQVVMNGDKTVSAVFAADIYTVTDLGTLGGSNSVAYGLNDFGLVVGWAETADGDYHAFRWDHGPMTDLGTFGGPGSRANGVNNADLVVGWAEAAQGATAKAALSLSEAAAESTGIAFFHHNGAMAEFDSLGGLGSIAHAVSHNGLVVGWSSIGDGGPHHAVLWLDGRVIDLGTLGGPESGAYALNEFAQIVGESLTADGLKRAFLWQDCQMTDLTTLGGQTSSAYGINNAGQIVGTSQTPAGQDHAFLWDNGLMTDLGTLGGLSSVAYGINEGGQVVGMSFAANGNRVAFLWQNDRMTDLNAQLPPDAGWVLRVAFAINEPGQIVGAGSFAGQTRAFLLTPAVPNDVPTGGPNEPPVIDCPPPPVPQPLPDDGTTPSTLPCVLGMVGVLAFMMVGFGSVTTGLRRHGHPSRQR